MKNKIWSTVLLTGSLVYSGCGESGTTPSDTPTSGKINISVDESFQPIIESQVSTYEGIYKRADITASYKSEGEVIEDMLNDSTRIGVLSRDLTPQEKAVFEKKKLIPRVTKFAVDAVAIIVNRNNPDSLFTLDELKSIFSGRTKSWSQYNSDSKLKNITIVFDGNNSGTARFVKDSIIANNRLPQNTYATDSHEALIDYVEKNENALGVIGVNWISDFDDSTAVGFQKRIKVAGISAEAVPRSTESYYQPYQAYIAQEVYPLRRYLYIINTTGRSGLGTGFVSFVAGDKGQRIILKSGLVPATSPVRVVGIR